MGDVAGSGGYYIAMGAKKIFAEPGTITGSIGVIGGKLVTGGLYDKIGLTTEVISRGKNSGSLSSSQPFTPDERKAWTELLEETYRQFVSKAAQGRKMTGDRLEKLAQGRVYTGRMAKKQRPDRRDWARSHDAIAEAKKAAGLKPDDDVDLLILPKPKTIFEQLFGDGVGHDRPGVGHARGCSRTLRQTQALAAIAQPSAVLLWMPYGVQVK